jgi:hypothetical protein
VPIWIGGNSALTRRRVAAHADGWNPFPATAGLAKTARTVPLEGLDDLVPMLDDLWIQVDKAGRDRSQIDVAFTTGLPGPSDAAFRPDEQLEAIGKLTGLGVTWVSPYIPGDSLDQAVEAIERYGREVIAAR